MNSRERVLTALAHERPDRVPIIIGTSNTTSIKMGAYRRLKAHLGITAPDRYIYDWPELGAAAINEATLARLQAATDHAVIGTPWLLFPLERACAMQGLDTFLMHMALAPDFARSLLMKIASLCKQLMGCFLAECGDLIDIMGGDGGYMLASVHTIMDDVPPANIVAMVDAVVE